MVACHRYEKRNDNVVDKVGGLHGGKTALPRSSRAHGQVGGTMMKLEFDNIYSNKFANKRGESAMGHQGELAKHMDPRYRLVLPKTEMIDGVAKPTMMVNTREGEREVLPSRSFMRVGYGLAANNPGRSPDF